MCDYIYQNLKKFSAVLLLIASLSATGCSVVEHRILYDPYSATKSWNQPAEYELVGVDFEEANFLSQDGTRLHGWFVRPDDRTPKNVILFSHGRRGNVSGFNERLFDFVRRHQVAIMLFDYRGYGKSEGRPSEFGLYADATAARNWLATRTGCSPSDIILMGRSLGAAVAIDLASRDGAKALIVENGFTSTAAVLRHHTRNLLKGNRLKAVFDSENKIGRFSGPVFVSHGENDKAIPYSHGVRLANRAVSATRVQFLSHEGGHLTAPDEEYEASLGEFLRSL